MAYNPQPEDEGFGMVKAALRDYIIADLSAYGLPSVIELLPDGAGGVIDEGTLASDTRTPVVMFTTTGDGQTAEVKDNTLARFIVYAIDRGRGLSTVERIIHRVRRRLNTTQLVLNFLTLPRASGLEVVFLEASGSTASVSLPAWKAEARGLYVFVTIKGLEADGWSS